MADKIADTLKHSLPVSTDMFAKCDFNLLLQMVKKTDCRTVYCLFSRTVFDASTFREPY